MTDTASNDNHALPLPFWPRGLSRQLAAAYIGVGPSLFDVLVRDHRMPAGKPVNSRVIWDRHEIDLAFDAIDGRVAAPKAEGWEFAA